MRTTGRGGNPAWWILKGLGILIVVAAVVSLLSLIVMALWNAVLPTVFGLKPIDWPLALGLLVLARILFGFPGRHGHGWGHGPGRRFGFGGEGWGRRADQWKHYRDFWKDEGEAAFDAYLKKKQDQPKE
jgi:hypothetical protein